MSEHNDIVVFMIPDFIDINSPWRVLPYGIHDATMNEVEERYAITEHRKLLFDGFQKGAEYLWRAGCRVIFLDGSFITEKEKPNDFDVCWDPTGVSPRQLNPVFFDFSNKRAAQKKQFKGEFFPSTAKADSTSFFIDFFQIDKYTGTAKGIVRIHSPLATSKGGNS